MNANVTLSAVINTTVALPCDIILDLTITFTWQFDGVNLDPSTSEGMYEILPNGSLVISDVRESHEGTYTCVATNSLGVASGNVLLTVNSKLTILLSLLIRMRNVKLKFVNRVIPSTYYGNNCFQFTSISIFIIVEILSIMYCTILFVNNINIL